MRNSVYNIAILGCGKVAHLHASAIQNLPNARLAGVWSRTQQTANGFACQYKVPAYTDVAELIKKEKINLAVVCTPHPFHLEPAQQAALQGANILVEKPLASTLEDADKIISTCKKAGVKLGVVSQRRWYEPVLRVKKAIEAGKIGKPVLGTVNMLGWRDKSYYDADKWRGNWKTEGGGVLVNQAPHQLDILLWFMGEVEEVYGIWRNLNHPYIEVEDTALAVIKFRNGGIGNVIVSNSQKPGIYGKVHVHGENGASAGVQTDGGAMFIAGMKGILEPPVNDLWTIPGEEELAEKWKMEDVRHFSSIDPMTHYMERQIEDFLFALDENRDPLVTGEDGRRTVELFTAIYRSTRDNLPIKLPLYPENKNDMDGRSGLL
ncbi:Gfo/Idh/MocA family oxidoreductase [Petrimonas sulfuriphila]|jgi:predicted dehydrogenase|uniref:Gfo/Idh/MocA family protein n=1 Tax=Petrimonas sulfuriphila TaxID=285070 RepID=UPI000E8449CE|nr:Gfo/Idh/MocA family oxidoreductase [Petrimonas sp.]HAC73142.1 oxidoreductase [Porphyromonadaceae bacterium]HBF96313.1 oxidoreductase [Porphyromonadaceae bacterium]HBU45172.1 oxidoreductase [Porphyromonadaceae bacterium]